MSFAPEVIADNSGKFVGNALRFATRKRPKGTYEICTHAGPPSGKRGPWNPRMQLITTGSKVRV
jgi:hypothetical protein